MPAIHVILNILLVAGFFGLGFYLAKKGRGARICAISVAFLVGALGYFLNFRPDIFTRLFPFSFVIFYSSWYPLAVVLIGPSAFHFGKNRFQRIRLSVLLSLLFLLSLYPFYYYFLPSAHTGDLRIDENGICRQSSLDTCSAAACVTLLGRYGISVTETEVARLALTRKKIGTRTLGEYRALKILLDESGKKGKVRIRRMDSGELLNFPGDCIVTVGLEKRDPKNEIERDLAGKYQWTPGVMHDVVYLGRKPGEPDKVLIGEPDFGLETWWAFQLKHLFRGYAVTVEMEND